jgi:hypothetical protein
MGEFDFAQGSKSPPPAASPGSHPEVTPRHDLTMTSTYRMNANVSSSSSLSAISPILIQKRFFAVFSGLGRGEW